MESKLTRKYGLLTAVCMVVGTVIGSGIFFRNEEILANIGGQMWIGVAAWVVGGFITLTSAYVFAILSTRYETVGGIVDYSEAMLGKTYGYMFGWFMATIFYPSLCAILAWVSARFTVILFGWDVDPAFSGQTFMLALFYMIAIYAMNSLSPKLAGKFQVSCTFIKLMPLIAMGIVGTVSGLTNGVTVANIHSGYIPQVDSNPFFVALLATVFAYLGWDAVVAINSEIKNSKRNLPIALVGGMLIIITVYVLYFIGIFSSAPLEELAGGEGVRGAFVSIFGGAAGTILFVFIVISCLGTLNGLTVGSQRAFYSLAVRMRGPRPDVLSQVDNVTNAPYNAAIASLFMIAFWTVVYGANFAGWYGDFFLDLPGIVPIAFQGFLVPMFLRVIQTEKDLGIFNRYIAPILACAGSLFLIYIIIYVQQLALLRFMLIFAFFMIVGTYFYCKKMAK